MTDEERIRTALVEASKTRGKQAEIASAFEVSHATVKRWVEGEAIPAAMQKLLKLYLFGEIPFGDVRPAEDLRSILEFTQAEWRLITVLAARAGQEPAAWIRSQILAYLAFCDQTGSRPAANPLRSLPMVAEPGESYGPRSAGDAKGGGPSPSGSDEGVA